ncbi:MAG: hypothetical protein L3J97_05900 [Thermoplasmata archaeon]|nr:hypothetical protein [Thermoplasmata archaeon]
MIDELPIYHDERAAPSATRDLARGWNVLLFWGGPLAWVLLASVADLLLRLSFDQFGILLVIGTAWFGTICLVNALRCGRSHCWIDGVLLPLLVVVGGLNLMNIVHLSWGTYLSAFWSILVASVVVECVVGSYPRSRSSA